MPQKSILITGCGPDGIGAALAKSFQLRGHRVFATGRTTAEIDSSLADLGIITFILDVTDEGSIKAAVATVRDLTGGKLDILVNNAGLLHVLPFADTAITDVKRLFDVNVIAVWAVTQAFLPLLLESQGLVTALGSINAVLCPPFHAGYNSSKAAVEVLLRTLRREVVTLGVRVVILKTGSVGTNLFANAAASVLPETSLYLPIRTWIEERGFLASAKFIDVDEFAQQVTSGLLQDSPKAVIWKGGWVFVAWLMSWFGWETMMDAELIKGSGLHKIHYKPLS